MERRLPSVSAMAFRRVTHLNPWVGEGAHPAVFPLSDTNCAICIEGAQRLNKGMSQSFYLLTPLVYSITNFDLGFDKIVTFYCINHLISLTKSLISLVFLFLINFITELFIREFLWGKL